MECDIEPSSYFSTPLISILLFDCVSSSRANVWRSDLMAIFRSCTLILFVTFKDENVFSFKFVIGSLSILSLTNSLNLLFSLSHALSKSSTTGCWCSNTRGYTSKGVPRLVKDVIVWSHFSMLSVSYLIRLIPKSFGLLLVDEPFVSHCHHCSKESIFKRHNATYMYFKICIS